MIKLITCDVDGTLLKDYADKINPELFTLINKFYEKNVLFFASSGRQLYNLQQIFSPVKDKIGYIAENGALMVYNNETLYKSSIDKALAKNISKKILDKDGAELFISGEKLTYVIPKSNKVDRFIKGDIPNKIGVINTFDDIEEDVLKVSFFYEKGLNDDIINYFVKDFGNKFQHAASGDTWYDFMNLNTHKGNAISILQNNKNISKGETIAFGDNFNDIEMFQNAQYSYAMENAHKNVKKHANFICKDVVETLKEIYNKFFKE